MKIFIKYLWYLSVIVIFLFYALFEGYRISDYILGNYTIQKMSINNSSYNYTQKRKSITVDGTINGEKVYFSRFDEDIDELHNLYPFIFSNNKNTSIIEVLKFKHSKVVMLLNGEFTKWKKHLLISSLYLFFSILFFSIYYLKIK